MIFNIFMSFITQVLSNKMKYSPNENNQQKASLNTEAPQQNKSESTIEE